MAKKAIYTTFKFIEKHKFIILIALLLLIPALSEHLYARPGGGHSYSGGGGRSSGGGSGGGGDIGFLIYLLFEVLPPQISIPLIIIIIVGRIYLTRKRNKNATTFAATPTHEVRSNAVKNSALSISEIKKQDPNFSKTLFLDFASSLFNKYYTWFGTEKFKDLRPFFTENEFVNSKSANKNQQILEIVIGNIVISDIQNYNNITGLVVDIDANFTVITNRKRTRYQVTERWFFNRNRNILSKEPLQMQELACPNCGAPTNFTDAGNCNSCGTHINAGEMQWFVKSHKVLRQEVFKTSGLAHYENEQGTNLPSIWQPNLQQHAENYMRKIGEDWNNWYPEFSELVVEKYFFAIYQAWSANNLLKIRQLLSDRTYENFTFWINAFVTTGLQNKLEDIEIDDIELVNIDIDKFYEAVTVRIFAKAKDFVINTSGKVIGGSAKKARKYSEYWTFIRRAGLTKKLHDFSTCPNCGAPSDHIGQAGECDYCQTKISTGNFSWVLTSITQDEVYSG